MSTPYLPQTAADPLAPSLVRTIVPIIVGALAATLLASLGIALPIEATSEVMTVLLSGLYYALVRVLERRWPGIGVFLGSTQQPVYTTPPVPEDPVVVEGDEFLMIEGDENDTFSDFEGDDEFDETPPYVGKHREEG